MVNILCIDPGIINLAFSYLYISDEELKIIFYKKIDITYYSKSISDAIDKFCKEYKNIIELSYKIIIEKQPPTGAALVVQELLYSKLKNRIIYLNPKTVSAYFGTSKLTYEKRKKRNVEIANEFFKIKETSYDICDSLCLSIYYKENMSDSLDIKERFKEYTFKKQNPFDKYAYCRKK